jgi:MATE family multidrug resistance protein
MFVFLRKGTTGLAAQANGAKNFQEVRATAARSIAMGLLIGCLLVIFRGPLMTAVFAWQKPPEYAYNECVQYYYARMWGSPFALANFAVQGFLNGMKRSRQVLCQQVTLNVANAAFCLLLASNIGPLHLGAAGIGHAASIANLVAFFNGMVQVYQCLHGLDEPEPGEWSIGQIFKADPLKEMFANAGAITLRSLCLTGTQTSITAVAARMTTPEHPYLAANLLLMQLHMLFAMGSDGFSNAAEALVGEAIGRKDVRRMYRVVKAACKWALGIACFFSLLWLSLGRFFFEQMTDAATRDTSNEACHYLLWLVFAQPFAVWAFLMDGFFVGATLAKEMLYSMIFATLGFAITVYILVGKAVNFPQLGPFPLNSGNNGLWLSFYSFLVYRSLSLLAQWKSIEVKCTPNL